MFDKEHADGFVLSFWSREIGRFGAKFAPTAILFGFVRVRIFLSLKPKRQPIDTSFLRCLAFPGLHKNMVAGR